jgi:glutamate decarboxylase
VLHNHRQGERTSGQLSVNPMFGQDTATFQVPKHRLPNEPMLPDTAYQLVHDHLMLDGNARLNLATFVTTWMESQAGQLMTESVAKNLIDKDEYPQTAELENRCVNMLARLWNVPGDTPGPGCSTAGSSEAAMFAGLALKRRWQQRRDAEGRSKTRPNLVMGINVQVCWEKFCTYFEVEPRFVPMKGERFHLEAEEAVALCDENTIGVITILGSTFDGSYEPVADIAAALDALEKREGLDVPMHVDAASGGMIAPFVDPELVWDFRLPRVASINTSGHKYGLVYPGLGWVLWRDGDALPEELVFHVNYLGGEMPTLALNFSRPAAQVVAQYYTFLRLGFDGFRRVQQECRDVATYLAGEVERLGDFRLLTRGEQLPVFAFAMGDHVTNISVFDVSAGLRERGWIVPAYTLPPEREDLSALRIVVRNGFNRELADLLLADLRRLLPRLRKQTQPSRGPEEGSFDHAGSSGRRGPGRKGNPGS